MKWLELSVTAPPEYVEPLSQIFYRYGQGGVAIEEKGGYNLDEGETPSASDWVTLKTYIPVNSTTDERRNRIDLGVRLVAHVSPISPLRERVLDEEEWANSWKEHFHVLHIGRRIVISPTWREYAPQDSDVVISLDPGMAFGTGHHPTTRMCLEQLEELMRPGLDVLDVGCGSGILSIAAARLGARRVLGMEIDSVAVNVAKKNVDENGVAHTIHVIEGTLPYPGVRADSYDLALANISSKVVAEIAGDLARVVRPGGKIVASGILLDNKHLVENALAASNCALEKTLVDGDWVTLVASVR
ncbi:MAG: 50S ribosomal protein L11 methyltransferase [Chloroflexi bacterium]|nr:50S ribosomal protein L11 methyltransferase [Chloroflexota bacterium]